MVHLTARASQAVVCGNLAARSPGSTWPTCAGPLANTRQAVTDARADAPSNAQPSSNTSSKQVALDGVACVAKRYGFDTLLDSFVREVAQNRW
jgi:hypothetical protein